MTIEFKNPPSKVTGPKSSKHDPIAAQLKERPGEWALILTAASPSTAAAVKRGLIKAYRPPGSFEATARDAKNGRADIYARFVGEAKS